MKLKENLQENNINQGEEMEILLDGKKVSENISKLEFYLSYALFDFSK